MSYFFNKMTISSLNKGKGDIRSAYVLFCFFHVTVNSHNLATANHCPVSQEVKYFMTLRTPSDICYSAK